MITVYRNGNIVVVDAAESIRQSVYDLLSVNASFVETRFLRGKEYYDARRMGRRTVQYHTHHLFTYDHKGRFTVPLGLWYRLADVLRSKKFQYVKKDATQYPNPQAYEPDWSAVQDMKFRPGQRQVLELPTKHICGRILCPAGWGKSFLIGAWCCLFRKARIGIVTRRVEVIQQRLYPSLAGQLPDVGMVGGGKKKFGRVTCFTAASLHHAPEDLDFVIFDEGHEAASDDCAEKMMRFRHAHMWGLSASWDMRLDGKDMRCEAMFGPIRFKVGYDEAVQDRMVVPIVVQLSEVAMSFDPAFGLEDVQRERAAIWANRVRNAQIAKDARVYGPDVQVLVSVRTLEHALRLKEFLPEFELVYNSESQSEEDWNWFKSVGLIKKGFEILTPEKREKLRRDFERGIVKKVIATTVWNVGVDMRQLQVVIRADAGGSPINDVQIPGRGSRVFTFPDGRKKTCAVIHDYIDVFNHTYEHRSKSRIRSYKQQGWLILYPEHFNTNRLQELVSGHESKKTCNLPET